MFEGYFAVTYDQISTHVNGGPSKRVKHAETGGATTPINGKTALW